MVGCGSIPRRNGFVFLAQYKGTNAIPAKTPTSGALIQNEYDGKKELLTMALPHALDALTEVKVPKMETSLVGIHTTETCGPV